jgi:membrane protein implicated in regulation of membrane protease activity
MTLKQAYTTFVVTPLVLGMAGGMMLLAMLCVTTGALFSMLVIANAWVFLINHINDGLILFLALFVVSVLGLALIKRIDGYKSNDDDKRPSEGRF